MEQPAQYRGSGSELSAVRRCTLVVLIFGGIVIGACGPPAPIVTVNGNEARIDVQFLGEYPSKIGRIRLEDVVSKKVLWEVEAKSDQMQINFVRIRAGVNRTSNPDIESLQSRLVEPQTDEFVLDRGRTYRVTVWAPRPSQRSKEALLMFR